MERWEPTLQHDRCFAEEQIADKNHHIGARPILRE